MKPNETTTKHVKTHETTLKHMKPLPTHRKKAEHRKSHEPRRNKKKTRGHFRAPLGPDVRFPSGKTNVAKMALWVPRVLSEGSPGLSVAHLTPFRDLGGSLRPPVSALGAPRAPGTTVRQKIENDFWGRLGAPRPQRLSDVQ